MAGNIPIPPGVTIGPIAPKIVAIKAILNDRCIVSGKHRKITYAPRIQINQINNELKIKSRGFFSLKIDLMPSRKPNSMCLIFLYNFVSTIFFLRINIMKIAKITEMMKMTIRYFIFWNEIT